VTPALRFSSGSCVLSGQPGLSNLAELSQQLLLQAGKPGDIVIELREISTCDSSFVALLAACLQIKKRQQRSLTLLNSPQKLLAMFRVYRLLESGFRFS
jgi:ABC-type transporter Mla MlaB component